MDTPGRPASSRLVDGQGSPSSTSSLLRAVAAACPIMPPVAVPMCPDVPSASGEMCPDVPSPGAGERAKGARMCPDLPDCASAAGENPGRETKPTPKPRALTDAQLAAIRLTVRGFGSKAVARHLGLNHHTIGRWKRDPRFAGAVEQLRAQATAATLASAASVPAARGPDPRRPPGAVTAPAAADRATRRASPTALSAKDEALVERLMRLTRRVPRTPPE